MLTEQEAEEAFQAWVKDYRKGLEAPMATFLSEEHLRAAWMAALSKAGDLEKTFRLPPL